MLYLVLNKMCKLMCAAFFLYHERLLIISLLCLNMSNKDYLKKKLDIL